MYSRTVIVIGGGPAGIMAAIAAGRSKKKVILIEKNNEIGRKLSITGGGRCNITNACELEEIIQKTITNGKFLYSVLHTFNSNDLIKLLEENGLKVKVEEKGKVFPLSDRSVDVIQLFKKLLDHYRGELLFNTKVEKILVKNQKVVGVELQGGSIIKGNSVIIATGGMSYPQTGSTGEGYRICSQLGHKIIPIKPSLVPIEIQETWVKELMGVSLNDVVIAFKAGNNKKYESRGPLLFTHYGISGPAVLELSAYLNRYLRDMPSKLKIDLLPNLKETEFQEWVLSKKEKDSNKELKTILSEVLPRNLAVKIVCLLEIKENCPLNQLTKKDRNKLVEFIKNIEITPLRLRSIKEAIVTSGGVDIREINSKTMASELIEGLYFAGEIIDVDALTGGYNLQIAFSTGYVAGLNA